MALVLKIMQGLFVDDGRDLIHHLKNAWNSALGISMEMERRRVLIFDIIS
jgi:hypothetical protein